MSTYQASHDMLRLYGLSQVELTAARERVAELEKENAELRKTLEMVSANLPTDELANAPST